MNTNRRVLISAKNLRKALKKDFYKTITDDNGNEVEVCRCGKKKGHTWFCPLVHIGVIEYHAGILNKKDDK